MAFENISEWVSHLSIESVLKGDVSVLLPLFYLVVSMAIYSILIWHFYRFIAQRDCFKLSTSRYAKIGAFFKYFCVFPFVAFLFFTGFSLIMLFMTRRYELVGILSTSFAIVVAIRMTAYYNEDLSKDVAKMLPFALLGLFLVDPSYFSVGEIMAKIALLPEFFTMCVQFILLIIMVEWLLRIILTIKHVVVARHQRVSDTERTVVSASSG